MALHEQTKERQLFTFKTGTKGKYPGYSSIPIIDNNVEFKRGFGDFLSNGWIAPKCASNKFEREFIVLPYIKMPALCQIHSTVYTVNHAK